MWWTRRILAGAALAGGLALLGAGEAGSQTGSPQAAPAATQPSGGGVKAGGRIEGVVTAESEVPLSEMVIYLESPDPARAMPAVSKEPVVVSQKGAKFEPRLVIICVGQAVSFVNDEDRAIEHNVFSASPANKFDLGTYPPGQSKAVTFDKAGPVSISCSIHRYMDGVIYVAPTPWASKVSEDGRFAIEGVPPGEWVVKTWQRRKRFMEQSIPVTVVEGKPVTADILLKKRS